MSRRRAKEQPVGRPGEGKRRSPVEPSRRYTPPAWRVYRPRSHKLIGACLVALGAALILVNYADYTDLNLLPGGHQEAYFFLGILIAASGAWWFGWFDR